MKFGLPTFLKRTKKDPINKAPKKSKTGGGANQPGQPQQLQHHKQQQQQQQQNKKDQFQPPKHKGTFYTYNKAADSRDDPSAPRASQPALAIQRQEDKPVPLPTLDDRWIRVGEPLPAAIFSHNHTVLSATSHNNGGSNQTDAADASNADFHNHEDFVFITLMVYAPQTMENACVREIRQINPDIIILRDAAWVQVLRSLGYRTHGHIHYRPDKFTVFAITGQATHYPSPVVNNNNIDRSNGVLHRNGSVNNSGGARDVGESFTQQYQQEVQTAVVLQHLNTWDRIIVSSSGSMQAGVVDLAARFQPVEGTSRDNNTLYTPVIVAGNVPVGLQSLYSQQLQPQQQNQAQTCLSLKETAGFWYSDTTLALDEYLETPQGNEFAVRFRLRSGISSQYYHRYMAA